MDWNRRESTRYVWPVLVISTFVLCACFVFISISFGTDYGSIPRRSTNQMPQSEKLTGQDCSPVCGSKDCILQSNLLLEHMQPAFNPCDEFYKFTCGQYLGSHFDAESFASRYVKRMRIKLRNILERLDPIPESAADKMKIVYDSCMKRSSETQATPTLLEILDEFGLENWPNINIDFKFENITLTKVIANLLVHEEYGFVMLDNIDMSTHQSILRLFLSDSPYELKEQHVIKFQINQILKYLKIDDEAAAKIKEEAEAVHRAIQHLKNESMRIYEEGRYSVAKDVDCSREMENEWMDLCEVLKFFVDNANAHEEVNRKSLSIKESAIYFMQNIFPMLRNFTDRSIANYLAINVFLNHLKDLNIYFRLTHQIGESDIEKLEDMATPFEHWQYCVHWISSEMAIGLLPEYLSKEFTITMLDEMDNLTYEMIQATADYFSRQEWVSKNVRADLTEQIRNIIVTTPFLMKFIKDNFAGKFYELYKPREGSFLRNVMEFRKFQIAGLIRGFHPMALIRKSVLTRILLPGASGGGGEISINLGVLFPPTYSPRVKRIFNIVSLGMIIVHEIGHNIFFMMDYEKFTEEEKNYLQSSVKCVSDQVSQYRFELIGKNLNGSQYFFEDIADNIAVPVIDKLIEKYLSEGEDTFFPGLHYSTKQVLYTYSALTWCSVLTKEKEEVAYSVASHSPEQFRIYQLRRNSKGFSEAFQCPVGSFMNPADKCLMLKEGKAV